MDCFQKFSLSNNWMLDPTFNSTDKSLESSTYQLLNLAIHESVILDAKHKLASTI